MSDLTYLNLSWVTPELAVGGSFETSAISHLTNALAIRHIVDARDEAMDDRVTLRAHGVDFLHVPTLDHHAMEVADLNTGVDWVVSRLLRPERVLIHCEHGIGRSVLLSLCVLVRIGHSPMDALTHIKQVRPVASPSPAQLEAFIAWSKTYAAAQPTWDELSRVAYHLPKTPLSAAHLLPDEGAGA